MVLPIDVRLPLPGDQAWLGGLRWANPEGRPTLALHGWLDNAASFVPLGPYLTGLDLVAVDLPGHGHSSHRPQGSEYPLLGYLPDLLNAVDALGWPRCNLLCHSLGAALGLFMAGLAPERFPRVVVIDGLGPRTMRAEDAPDVAKTAMEARRSPLRQRVYAHAEEAIARMVAARPMMSPASVQVLADRNLRTVEGGVAWRHDPRLQLPSWQRLTEPEVCAWLTRVESEVLLIRPDEGWAFDDDAYGDRVRSMKHLTKVVVPGKHHVHMDEPETIAEHIRGWLCA